MGLGFNKTIFKTFDMNLCIASTISDFVDKLV